MLNSRTQANNNKAIDDNPPILWQYRSSIIANLTQFKNYYQSNNFLVSEEIEEAAGTQTLLRAIPRFLTFLIGI